MGDDNDDQFPSSSAAKDETGDSSQYNFVGVIGYLEHQYFQYQQDRKNWEKEREDMEGRIAVLTGREKSYKNIQRDLLLRIKMLEFALKQERAKHIGTESIEKIPETDTSQIPPAITLKRPERRKKAILEQYLAQFEQKSNLFFPASCLTSSQDDDTSVQEPSPKESKPQTPPKQTQPEEEESSSVVKRKSLPLNKLKGRTKKKNRGHAQKQNALNFLAKLREGKKSTEKESIISQLSESDTQRHEPQKQEPEDGIQIGDVESELKEQLATSPVNSQSKASDHIMWAPTFTLRHHMDTVRSLAFHFTKPLLVSASEDYTLKLWNWKYARAVTADIDPVVTYRGHRGHIYAVVIDSDRGKIFSAGSDKCVRVWSLPEEQVEPYAENGKAIVYSEGVLMGHSESIWDLSLHSRSPMLLSSSADASVRLWNFQKSDTTSLRTLLHSRDGENENCLPTSVSFVPSEQQQCVAAYRSGDLVVFDVETGQAVSKLSDDEDASHINKVVIHPSLAVAVTAHENKRIKFWDLSTGKCTHSMVAHQEPVTTLAFTPSGHEILTGGCGCSLRFWNVITKKCTQELSAHRVKNRDGICSVAFHPTLNFMASGGADSNIKMYQTS
eukprot:TRINITY_DN665_c0_g1_i2.p1 TRINITY_DN665_c0_g1~~TRINITY_DN665_c0_g1_i2.p1  ORF type:complete len:613 (-),score=100.28 TRINITY_DN665_c0_g1_i2:50-1888(-)